MLDGYTPERGQTFNPVHDSMLQRRAENLHRARNRAVRLCFVYGYDPLAQTVDIVLMDDRRAHPIYTIPIAGAGGNGARVIRAWKGGPTELKPDIGLLVVPRLGGGRRFLDFVRRDTRNLYDHLEETAIFLGGIPAALGAGEVQTANAVAASPALHQIGPRDNGFVNPQGAGILIKENGDVVVRGTRVLLDPVAVNGGDVPPVSDTVFAGRT